METRSLDVKSLKCHKLKNDQLEAGFYFYPWFSNPFICCSSILQSVFLSENSDIVNGLVRSAAASSNYVETCIRWLNVLASFPTRKNTISRKKYPAFHWLIMGHWTILDMRWLGLGARTVKNLLRLACKFDLDRRELKSSQANISARKA